MHKTLIIVGNGFDLFHSIPSKYIDFASFLKAKDSELYDLVETYFSVDQDFWWEFEERLAEFDAASLIDDAQEM